jgi:hypothetical protein
MFNDRHLKEQNMPQKQASSIEDLDEITQSYRTQNS